MGHIPLGGCDHSRKLQDRTSNLSSITSGIKRTIHWPSPSTTNPVPIQNEVQLLMSGALLRRGEFGSLAGSRILEVDLECSEAGLTYNQGVCIRKQLIMQKAMFGAWKLKDEKTMARINHNFECRIPLLEISFDYDLSPVSLFRSIVAQRVLNAHPKLSCLDNRSAAGRIVKSIIHEDNQDHVNDFVSSWELNELQIAKDNDIIGYQTNCTFAADWEETVYNFLDRNQINYITEDTIKLHGYEESGTPDCLLIDDLYINGQQIRWIEFKSFFASGLRENTFFTKKSICRQIKKYDEAYGQGAMVLKHGYSEKFPSTLFLDGGPLIKDDHQSLWM